MGVNQFEIESVNASAARGLRWRYWLGPALLAVDVLAVWLVVHGASFIYHAFAYGHAGSWKLAAELATCLSLVFAFINLVQGRYRIGNYLTAQGQMPEALKVWSVSIIAFLAIAFMTKTIDEHSRAVVLLSYAAGVVVIALSRRVVVQAVMAASRAGRLATERVLIVGEERDVLNFVARHRPWNVGFMIIDAVFLDRPAEADHATRDRALLASLETAKMRVRALRPDSVFIAAPWSHRRLIEHCADAFMEVPVAIHLVPEEIMSRFQRPRITRIGSVTTLQFMRPPLTPFEVLAKRAFDITGASVALFLLTPILALIALALRIEGKGPVLFAQRRYGFNQNMFRIYKFRTMITADDGAVVPQARRNDPRVTCVGRFLRRHNLDELPQLINVLMGDMSLVGPRPHALAHDHEFEEKISLYARRHNVKPGITGWAQVHGFRGPTDTDDKMRARVEHDLWYIDNWSLGLDLLILARTIFSPRAYRNAF